MKSLLILLTCIGLGGCFDTSQSPAETIAKVQQNVVELGQATQNVKTTVLQTAGDVSERSQGVLEAARTVLTTTGEVAAAVVGMAKTELTAAGAIVLEGPGPGPAQVEPAQ